MLKNIISPAPFAVFQKLPIFALIFDIKNLY